MGAPFLITDAGRRTHFTHNPESSDAAGFCADSAHGLARVAKLFCDLRAAGVKAHPTLDGRVDVQGAVTALTTDLLDRLRANRDELVELLERFEERLAIAEADGELSHEDAERFALAEVMAVEPADRPRMSPIADKTDAVDVDHANDGAGPGESTTGSIRCPWCGPFELRDDPAGLRCVRCERLAWVQVGRSIFRADDLEDDLEGLSPEDAPGCPNCGRWCDVETVAGTWCCSQCDPRADARRRRSVRILERAEAIQDASDFGSAHQEVG